MSPDKETLRYSAIFGAIKNVLLTFRVRTRTPELRKRISVRCRMLSEGKPQASTSSIGQELGKLNGAISVGFGANFSLASVL